LLEIIPLAYVLAHTILQKPSVGVGLRESILFASSFRFPLPVNIGYRCSMISIDAILLECWVMRSWEFDAVSHVEQNRVRKKESGVRAFLDNSNSQMVRATID
jgi:hypothetical protein